jgi:hypothetical protein
MRTTNKKSEKPVVGAFPGLAEDLLNDFYRVDTPVNAQAI